MDARECVGATHAIAIRCMASRLPVFDDSAEPSAGADRFLEWKLKDYDAFLVGDDEFSAIGGLPLKDGLAHDLAGAVSSFLSNCIQVGQIAAFLITGKLVCVLDVEKKLRHQRNSKAPPNVERGQRTMGPFQPGASEKKTVRFQTRGRDLDIVDHHVCCGLKD